MIGYHILDIFFLVFHTSLIIFNLFGWIVRKTRMLNLVVLLLTGSSWLFLGLLVGTLGYCPLTDWHFSVLEKLGITDLPGSYIKYLADRILNVNMNPATVDSVTLYTYISALIISLSLNFRDWLCRKKQK
jgi:hypothetical protein